MVSDTSEKVKLIYDKLKIAESHQKSYANLRRRDLEFQNGDYVFLKVSLAKDRLRFKQKGKLSRRFIGPFEVHK